MLVDIQDNVLETTKKWLNSRELEIFTDIEDLGDLRGLFMAILGREPFKFPNLETIVKHSNDITAINNQSNKLSRDNSFSFDGFFMGLADWPDKSKL